MGQIFKNSSFFKLTFVVFILLAGFLTLLRQFYLTEEVSRLSSQPAVLATTTFNSVEDTLPRVSTRQEPVASASATIVAPTSNFEVKVPILMYHHIRDVLLITDRSDIEFSVTPFSLEEQLRYLHENNFQTLSLRDISTSLEEGLPLPPKSVVLTFDDGFRDFYTSAFPLLKKYNMRAVCFYVGSYANFPGYMDEPMLREVHASGLVDIQPHSMSHLQLTSLKPEEQRQQIFESKQYIETLLGKKANYFAYPYGSFDSNTTGLVNEAGFKLAFGTTPGNTLRSSERLTLPRIAITGFDDLKRFSQKIGFEEKKVEPVLPEVEPPEATPSAKSNP